MFIKYHLVNEGSSSSLRNRHWLLLESQSRPRPQREASVLCSGLPVSTLRGTPTWARAPHLLRPHWIPRSHAPHPLKSPASVPLASNDPPRLSPTANHCPHLGQPSQPRKSPRWGSPCWVRRPLMLPSTCIHALSATTMHLQLCFPYRLWILWGQRLLLLWHSRCCEWRIARIKGHTT